MMFLETLLSAYLCRMHRNACVLKLACKSPLKVVRSQGILSPSWPRRLHSPTGNGGTGSHDESIEIKQKDTKGAERRGTRRGCTQTPHTHGQLQRFSPDPLTRSTLQTIKNVLDVTPARVPPFLRICRLCRRNWRVPRIRTSGELACAHGVACFCSSKNCTASVSFFSGPLAGYVQCLGSIILATFKLRCWKPGLVGLQSLDQSLGSPKGCRFAARNRVQLVSGAQLRTI